MLMIRKLLVLMLVLMLALTACGSDEGDDNDSVVFETITVQTAYDQFNETEGAYFVDVREANEWAATGYPPGATLIPLGEIAQRAPDELPEDAPIFVICNSGNRSLVASQQLRDMGYREIYNVDGGIQAWLQAGLPVEAYP